MSCAEDSSSSTFKMPTPADPESKRSKKRAAKQEKALADREEAKKRRKAEEKAKKAAYRDELVLRGSSSTTQVKVENGKVIEFTARGVCRPDLSPEENAKLAEEARRNRHLIKEQKKRDFLARADGNARILVDCDWENWMTEKERNSLASQLMYCFSANKRCERPSHFVCSGLGPQMQQAVSRMCGSEKWLAFHTTKECVLEKCFGGAKSSTTTNSNINESPPATVTTGGSVVLASEDKPTEETKKSVSSSSFDLSAYVTSLSPENTVYLTADSDNTLTGFEPEKTYILGGVVDRNRLKNCTKLKAERLGIPTARLPIGEYESEQNNYGTFSRVLTVNHCAEIILGWQETNGDWKTAIEKGIPKRRVGQGAERKKEGDEGKGE